MTIDTLAMVFYIMAIALMTMMLLLLISVIVILLQWKRRVEAIFENPIGRIAMAIGRDPGQLVGIASVLFATFFKSKFGKKQTS